MDQLEAGTTTPLNNITKSNSVMIGSERMDGADPQTDRETTSALLRLLSEPKSSIYTCSLLEYRFNYRSELSAILWRTASLWSWRTAAGSSGTSSSSTTSSCVQSRNHRWRCQYYVNIITGTKPPVGARSLHSSSNGTSLSLRWALTYNQYL